MPIWCSTMNAALQLYKQKKESLGLAARIAGVPLGGFLDFLKEYYLTLNLELEDAVESLGYAATMKPSPNGQ